MRALFPTGQVVATPGALDAVTEDQVLLLLNRHVTGDYGELDSFDKQQNTDALKLGNRILSAYTVNGTRIWIITEADRSSTTILLPEEY